MGLLTALLVMGGAFYVHRLTVLDPYRPGTSHTVTFKPPPAPCVGPVAFDFTGPDGAFYNFESHGPMPPQWLHRSLKGTLRISGHWWDDLSPRPPKVRYESATFQSGGTKVKLTGGRGVWGDLACGIN